MWMILLSMSSLLPTCYLPPVTARIVVPFEAPACPYCPGQRGLEYELVPGSTVRAAASGLVTFAGVVVGVRYVVVRHDDGTSATYGMLDVSALRAGDAVAAGQIVGTSTRRLYFGLKDSAGEPIDPTALLAIPSRRPRLVPVDGTPPRPATERAPSCSAPVPRGRSPR